MPRPKRSLVYSLPARRDLREIRNYLIREASIETAETLIRAMHGKLIVLEQRPLMGRSRGELAQGLRALLVDPYIAFYLVTDSNVEIVRVLHGSRNIEVIFQAVNE
jgi:toxin ParE1/3/4